MPSQDPRHPHAHPQGGPAWDPTYLNTRREALTIVCAWVVALLWSVPVSYATGYHAGAGADTVLGIPSWVFWGVAVPWGLASAFSLWFSLCRMTDDDLGRAGDEGEPS